MAATAPVQAHALLYANDRLFSVVTYAGKTLQETAEMAAQYLELEFQTSTDKREYKLLASTKRCSGHAGQAMPLDQFNDCTEASIAQSPRQPLVPPSSGPQLPFWRPWDGK